MKTIISITLLSTLLSFNAMAGVAAGTAVQVNNEAVAAIEKLEQGQMILTAMEGSSRDSISFQPSRLYFTSSSERDMESTAVFMSFGNDSELIMTLDQAVLTTNGSLVPASKLVPGVDQLVDASGKAVDINSLSVGMFHGQISDIAPDSNKVTENLYLGNGILLGSFKINMTLTPGNKMEAFVGQVLDF